MSRMRVAIVTGLAALVSACHDTTGPLAPDFSGSYIADSIYCRTSFDTGSEIVPLGASLTLTLHRDSTIAGRLVIPAAWMPDGLPTENDSLTGTWQATADGFHVYGPWGTLLYSVAFTVTADTARATIMVKNFPLDLFSYRLRVHRQ